MRISAIATVITMVLTSFTLAAKTPSFLKKNDNKSIVLRLDSWKSDYIVVSIKDQAGITVFSEKINRPAGSRKYDLSGLNKGEYGFVVEDGLKLAAQNIVIEEMGLAVNPETVEKFKPIFKSEGEVWQIQGLTQGTPAVLTIFNENGETVYTENINKPVVERSYDVSKLERGSYFITCKIGKDTYTYPASKK